MIVRAVLNNQSLIDNLDVYNDGTDTLAYLKRVNADQSTIDRLNERIADFRQYWIQSIKPKDNRT